MSKKVCDIVAKDNAQVKIEEIDCTKHIGEARTGTHCGTHASGNASVTVISTNCKETVGDTNNLASNSASTLTKATGPEPQTSLYQLKNSAKMSVTKQGGSTNIEKPRFDGIMRAAFVENNASLKMTRSKASIDVGKDEETTNGRKLEGGQRDNVGERVHLKICFIGRDVNGKQIERWSFLSTQKISALMDKVKEYHPNWNFEMLGPDDKQLVAEKSFADYGIKTNDTIKVGELLFQSSARPEQHCQLV